MFQVANNSKSDPIHIDAPAHVVNVFLNLASVSEPFPLETDFEDTAKLFELCDTIECAAIKRRVRERLNVLGALDPWRQLAFASEQDEIVMARVALRKMPSDPIVTLGTMTDLWSRPATLRAHWQLELLGRIMVKQQWRRRRTLLASHLPRGRGILLPRSVRRQESSRRLSWS